MNFNTTEYAVRASDITSDFTSVIELILNGIKFCFNFLASIQFFGTNLLNFSLTLLILAAVFPIIFSLVSSRVVSASNQEARARSARKSSNKEE